MHKVFTSIATLAALIGSGACGAPHRDARVPMRAVAPAQPEPSGPVTRVAPGGLAACLAAAKAGDTLVLEPGEHAGPFVVDKAVTIWGSHEAVVVSRGAGTTIAVEGEGAAGARLLGFVVDGSGTRFDKTDAAVRVRASRVEVRGVTVRRALFGILVELAKEVTIRDNHVVGSGQAAFGLRGDGIRFWEVEDSSIDGNSVVDARDVVVWYSSKNRVVHNRVSGCRYGTHFMYSHDNAVEDNEYVANVVGVFVMYSRDVALRRNLIARCSGAAGIGLGVKESGNLIVEDNALLGNTMSVYLDTSPLDRTHVNRFRGNQFSMSNVAVGFHASPHRNSFEGNSFRDNTRQVEVGGGGDAIATSWKGNYWGDYQGYDLDRDGVGDVPYELRSLSGELVSRKPELAFLRSCPALHMVDIVGHVLPLFAPKKLLVDDAPLAAVPALEWIDAR